MTQIDANDLRQTIEYELRQTNVLIDAKRAEAEGNGRRFANLEHEVGYVLGLRFVFDRLPDDAPAECTDEERPEDADLMERLAEADRLDHSR